MKKLIQMTAILLCSFSVVLGATDPAAQELFVTAKHQASLFHNQGSPFQLDVDFILQMRVPMAGHLTLKWAATDRWWRRIDMPGFEQIEIGNGDMHYTTRNLDFTPIRVGELFGLLQFAEGSEYLVVKKQKQHQDDSGIEITCLQVGQENVKAKPHEVCVNPASHEILRDEWQELPDERRKEEFLDYFDFAGHHCPRKLRLLVNGSAVITANIQNVAITSFDDGLFLPPKGAIERRYCNGMKRAVPVKTPDPAYPRSASENRLMGDTTVAMTVMTDGSVTNIRLIGTSTHSMDDATLQTLKGWRFKPAMCGSEPVVSDIEVVVSFRLW
jgi:TonB family protein